MGKGLETEASTPETDERSVEVSELVFQVLGHAKNRTLALLGSAFPSPTLFPLPKLALSLNKAVRRLDPWRTVEDLSTGSAPLPRQIGLRYLAMGCGVDAEEPGHHEWRYGGAEPFRRKPSLAQLGRLSQFSLKRLLVVAVHGWLFPVNAMTSAHHMAALDFSQPRCSARACPPRTDLRLLGYFQGIVDLDTQVPHRRLELGVPKQQLGPGRDLTDNAFMTATVLVIFGLVYLGMILGGLPFLQLDRTGIALLGAIAVIATEAVSVEQAARSIDLPTLLLLFAFMVVSAQMRLGGFYDWITVRLSALPISPPPLLGVLIAVVALLSAVFSNDIVCLAVAPVLVNACVRRSLDPVPFLLGLACAANIGSAATLIGNPQNMLIGQTLHLPFAGYAAEAAAPVLAGLVLTWTVIVVRVQGRWQLAGGATPEARPGFEAQALDRWQTAKGLVVALAILLSFLFAPWPREVVALTGAGVLLMSRRMHSSRMLGLVDWELLVLFMGLFVVNDALQRTDVPARLVADLATLGIRLDHPAPLFGAAFVLSNIVSNVPAVMLLMPVAHHPLSGPLLALASTFAGNLFIVGSIANIIVVDAAARRGVVIDWRQHARIGVPVTIATMTVTALYLWWRMRG